MTFRSTNFWVDFDIRGVPKLTTAQLVASLSKSSPLPGYLPPMFADLANLAVLPAA